MLQLDTQLTSRNLGVSVAHGEFVTPMVMVVYLYLPKNVPQCTMHNTTQNQAQWHTFEHIEEKRWHVYLHL
jgi:hypothetical protein